MTIKIPNPNNEEEEIEVMTPDEVQAQKDEITKAKDEEIKIAREDAEKYKRVASEQTNNFKKLNDMSAEEKAKLTTSELEAKKRAEASEAKVKELEDRYNTDTQTRIKTDKENALKEFHGEDSKMKEQLEKNYEMINYPGTDTESIKARAKLAADMYVGQMGKINPLRVHFSGGSPGTVEKKETDKFLESEKGQAGAKLMGIGEEKK